MTGRCRWQHPSSYLSATRSLTRASGEKESLQDGGDAPPVLVGVTEQLGGDQDMVGVESPEFASGDGDLSDP